MTNGERWLAGRNDLGRVALRLASAGEPPQGDEVEVEIPPGQSAAEWIEDKVWDSGTPRARSASERVDEARRARAGELRLLADAEGEESEVERRHVAAKAARVQGVPALSNRERAIHEAQEARYAKLTALLERVEAAGSVEEMESIQW